MYVDEYVFILNPTDGFGLSWFRYRVLFLVFKDRD